MRNLVIQGIALVAFAGCGAGQSASGVDMTLESALTTTITGPNGLIIDSQPDISTAKPLAGTVLIYKGDKPRGSTFSKTKDGPAIASVSISPGKTAHLDLEPWEYLASVQGVHCEETSFEVKTGKRTKLGLFCERS